MMQRESEAEQANLPAENAADRDDDEAPESTSDVPPPPAAPKFMTGRIDPSWKSKTANGS